MTFLPIAGRELRVAARKRSTFWVRVAAALVAGVIGSGFLILTLVRFPLGTASLGRGLFGALTWLSLAAALSAGLFFTSDCLSEEKREGTLGFLFLTDLGGYDVVLGKLLATSLRAFYALIAVFPVLAVTLLMGGVTGAQFWKTLLALVSAMFVSVAAGLFVSAVSRESQKAMAATLLLLLLLVAAGPASDAAFAALKQRAFSPALSLSSPGYLFVMAGAWGRTPYWPGLLVNQGVAWGLFGLACLLLPRVWQERPEKLSAPPAKWTHSWKYGWAGGRRDRRRKLIELNPVLWLACRERWQVNSLWVMAILLAGGLAAACTSEAGLGFWMVWSYLAGIFALVLYLGIASQTGRFFVEAQRNGLIELLLTTPLTGRRIVQGQWRALGRMFGMPLVVCLAAQLSGSVLVQQQTWSRLATTVPTPRARPVFTSAAGVTIVTNSARATTTATAGVTNVTVARNGAVMITASGTGPVAGSTGFGLTQPNALVTLAVSAGGTLTIIANLAALAWFGMWMGLNSKNTNLAALKTILFVQVIPWFGVSFVSGTLVSLLLFSGLMRASPTVPPQVILWYPLLFAGITSVLYLVKDAVFVLWSRRQLYSEFRERASRTLTPFRAPLPPPLPRASAPPPIPPA